MLSMENDEVLRSDSIFVVGYKSVIAILTQDIVDRINRYRRQVKALRGFFLLQQKEVY